LRGKVANEKNAQKTLGDYYAGTGIAMVTLI